MNTNIKTVFIKIARKLYEDGIPLSSGFGTGRGDRKPIFDGLFEVSYSNPTVDPDGTIRISCNGDVANVQYSVKNIKGITRISGELQQGAVGGVFLPSDSFIESTKNNIGDYLKNTARLTGENKINRIVDRLMEDIINNVPVKSIYKSLKQNKPADFGRVEALYLQRKRSELLSNLEEMVKTQGNYSVKFAGIQGMFIKTAAGDFKKGEQVSLSVEYIKKQLSSGKLDKKEVQRFTDEIKNIFEQMKAKGIDKKSLKYKNDSEKEGYAIVIGFNEDDEPVKKFEIPKFLLSRNSGEDGASEPVKEQLSKFGMKAEDLAKLNSYITKFGLSQYAFVALIAEAIETKQDIFDKDNKIDIQKFFKLDNTSWGNMADRAKANKMDKEVYYQALQSAGQKGQSFDQFVKEWRETQAKEKGETDKQTQMAQKDSEGRQKADGRTIEAYKSNPDKALFAELKKAGIDIYDQGKPDLLKAIPFKNAITDFYKNSSKEKKALLPKYFIGLVEGLQGGTNFSRAVMRYFDIPEEALKDKKILWMNFDAFVEMINRLKKDVNPKDIPRTILSVYRENMLEFGNNTMKTGLQQLGLDPNILRNIPEASKHKDKIKEIYDAITNKMPDYENPSVTKILEVPGQSNQKNKPTGQNQTPAPTTQTINYPPAGSQIQ